MTTLRGRAARNGLTEVPMRAFTMAVFYAALSISAARFSMDVDRQADGSSLQECALLVPDDIKAVASLSVAKIARDSIRGAGGTCVNFATDDGQVFLGVNRLDSRTAYDSAVEAVPRDSYPTMMSLMGVGDRGVLFKGPGNTRYLIAQKKNSGVVIFPAGSGLTMTDGQLQQLAKRALARITH